MSKKKKDQKKSLSVNDIVSICILLLLWVALASRKTSTTNLEWIGLFFVYRTIKPLFYSEL